VNYNLISELWIPVLWKTGNTSRVGIIDALTQAHEIRQIAASNPMNRLAILRFLLALLYWCRGNPPDDKDSLHSLPSNWFKTLDDNKDCFNLLGDRKRFYQDFTAKRPRPVTVLAQEIPAGNNFWHFRHATDKESGMCPACCAMGLLRLSLFAVSGLSGPGEPNLMAGINGVPPLYVAPLGKSLLESLLVNWMKCANIGEPSWSHPEASQDPNAEVSLLTGLTLLPRRVHLHDPIKAGSACTRCGSADLPLIYTCDYQTAGKQENAKWDDPHVLYLDGEARKAMRAADLTAAGRFRMDRPWADLVARILETGRTGTFFVVGFATNKAKNIDVWERSIKLRMDPSTSEAAPAMVMNWRAQGWALEKRLEKIARSVVEAAASMAAIRPQVEATISAKVGDLIAAEPKAWEQAAREYTPFMTAIAKSLSPGYTTTALQRRREIEYLRPDMQPKTKMDRRAGRKKGGDE